MKRLLCSWSQSITVPILICACIFTAESNGQTPTPTKSNESQKTQTTISQKPTTKDQRGTEQAPLVMKVIPPAKSDEETAQERKDREDRTTNERLLIFANILLVLFTALLAAFTAKLWWTAKDTAERQLRAYVSVSMVEINGIDGIQPPEATIVIKNYGQTPAYSVTHMGGIAFGDSFDTLPRAIGRKEMSNASLPPGEHNDIFQSAPRPLSVEENAALRAGTMTLWAYGEIHYRDAFKSEWFTEYRYMIGGQVGVRSNKMAICEEGNEAN